MATAKKKTLKHKIYSTEFFMIFPVSSSVANKKIFRKKTWGHGVKFVAMQQVSATLICDLNTMKGTMESYLERMQTIQNSTVLSLKNATNSKRPPKTQKTVLSHLKLCILLYCIISAITKLKKNTKIYHIYLPMNYSYLALT